MTSGDDPSVDQHLIGDTGTTTPYPTGATTLGANATSPTTTPAPAPAAAGYLPGSDTPSRPRPTPPDDKATPAGSGRDSNPVPCRICARPLSEPRIDYGRTTCREHYRLEQQQETR